MTILIFIVMLVLLVLVHELGHFAVAKFFGIRVDEFGIGFPPKLWGKKYGETEYTLNALPIGGFVRIWGEDPADVENVPETEKARSFVRAPKYAQALVLVAGVAMNVLFAFLLFVVGFMVGLPTALDAQTEQASTLRDARLLITGVLPESPADGVLKQSDVIVRLVRDTTVLAGENDHPLTPEAVASFLDIQAGKEVSVTVLRRGEEVTVPITPKTGVSKENPEKVLVGFTMVLAGTQQLPFLQAVSAGAERTISAFGDIAYGLGSFLLELVQGKGSFAGVAGPVGLVGLVGDASSLGFSWLITFAAMISLNLAVLNLLPFPALDGGRLVFVALEAVSRRTIPSIIASRINQAGFLALLALMLVVTVHDVLKLF